MSTALSYSIEKTLCSHNSKNSNSVDGQLTPISATITSSINAETTRRFLSFLADSAWWWLWFDGMVMALFRRRWAVWWKAAFDYDTSWNISRESWRGHWKCRRWYMSYFIVVSRQSKMSSGVKIWWRSPASSLSTRKISLEKLQPPFWRYRRLDDYVILGLIGWRDDIWNFNIVPHKHQSNEKLSDNQYIKMWWATWEAA